MVGQALDDAACGPVILAGGHMAGQIAVELACERPELVDRLIIDSIPMWDRDRRESISKLFGLSVPQPELAGEPGEDRDSSGSGNRPCLRLD